MALLLSVIWIVLGVVIGIFIWSSYLADVELARYLAERGYELKTFFIIIFVISWIALGLWIQQSIANAGFGALSTFFRSLSF